MPNGPLSPVPFLGEFLRDLCASVVTFARGCPGISGAVILSGAKNLAGRRGEILRCAQDDSRQHEFLHGATYVRSYSPVGLSHSGEMPTLSWRSEISSKKRWQLALAGSPPVKRIQRRSGVIAGWKWAF